MSQSRSPGEPSVTEPPTGGAASSRAAHARSDQENNGSLRRDIRRVALKLAAMLPMAAVLVVALVTTATLVVGWTPTVVASGSMAPRLRPGDILLVEPAHRENLEPDQVVLFEADYVAEGRVVHRLVRRRPSGRWITRGDANPRVDPRAVAPEDITGIVGGIIPRLGLPALWLRRGETLPLALLGTVLALSAWATTRLHGSTTG